MWSFAEERLWDLVESSEKIHTIFVPQWKVKLIEMLYLVTSTRIFMFKQIQLTFTVFKDVFAPANCGCMVI